MSKKKKYFVTRWKPGMEEEEYVGDGLLTWKKAKKLCDKLRKEDTTKECFTYVKLDDGSDGGFWNISVYKLLDSCSGYSEEVY